jgi:DNA-binding protein H-NS
MNYETVLTSLRTTLAADEKNHTECVERTARLSDEYAKAQAAEKAAADKMKQTKDTLLTIESLLQAQKATEGAYSGSTEVEADG